MNATSTTSMLRKLAAASHPKVGNSKFVYGASNIDILCHVASFLEAVAFMQTDIFRLRVIEAMAMAMVAVYSLFHTYNLLDCHFLWACFHVCIHTYNIYHIMAEYFSLKLTEDDEELWHGKKDADEFDEPSIFSIFSRAEFAVIHHHYEWKIFKEGEKVMTEGSHPKYLSYIVEGEGDVLIKGNNVAVVKKRSWLGEMSFFTNDNASATIVTKSKTMRVIRFDMHFLQHTALHSHGHSIETSAFSKLPSLFCKQIVHRTVSLNDQIIKSKTQIEHNKAKMRFRMIKQYIGTSKLMLKKSAKIAPEKIDKEDEKDKRNDFRIPQSTLQNNQGSRTDIIL